MNNLLEVIWFCCIFAPKTDDMAAIVNPFIATGKVPAELFCDRKDESKRLIQGLVNGANIVLMSPRRVGKTQLMLYCFDQHKICDSYTTIFIDILKTSTLQEFTFELGKAVFNTLASKGQKVLKMTLATMRSLTGNLGFDPITNLPKFNLAVGDIKDPTYSLEEIFRTLESAGHKCIVAIDEFQQITNYPEQNIEATLRSYIQQLTNTQFVFAGSERHLLEEMFLDSARPFFNSADIQHLDVISEDKYSDFVRHHFAVNGKRIDDETISKVYHIFEGNTYYNQKTFREAFAMTPADGLCNQETTDQVVSQMVNEANRHYSELFSRLTLPQKELLYAIAKEQRARQITSGDFIRRHSLKSASSVQSSIKKLLAYALVSTENNEYFIADQLMRLWLLR